MRRGIKGAGVALLALLVVACGSDRDELELTRLGQSLGKRITGGDAEAVAASQAAVLQVTRAQVDASPLPLMRVRLEGTGAMSTLFQADRKARGNAWFTADGVALYFREGMLIGTRGLGQDLMGLSSPGLGAAVAAGDVTRTWRYLDGDEQLVDVALDCQLDRAPHAPIEIVGRVHRVDQITEWCRGKDADGAPISFENFYWVSPGTTQIWQSRQYVSKKFGRAEIEVLKR